MKKFLMIIGILTITSIAHADSYRWGMTENGATLSTNESVIQISSTGVAGASVTVTMAGSTSVTNLGAVNQFVYVTDIHIEMYAAGTLTGGATPVTCTTTGLSGNPVFKFPTAAATGTINFYNIDYVYPLKETTAGTAVTITCPSTANVIWNAFANFYYDN